MVVFIKLFNSAHLKCLNAPEDEVLRCFTVKNWLKLQGFPEEEVWCECNGHKLNEDDQIFDGSVIHVLSRLSGGKGGFGSMLRAIGAQIEKTTNREACRDLSGRRLRDINEEQRLKRWVAKQVERERQAAKRRRAKLERLKTLPKHDFEDPNYDKQRAELPERIDDALNQGLTCQDVIPGQKRKAPELVDKPKKPCLWLGIDDEVQESEGSEDDTNNPEKSHAEESQSSITSEGSDSDSCRKIPDFSKYTFIANNSSSESQESTVEATNKNTENKIDESQGISDPVPQDKSLVLVSDHKPSKHTSTLTDQESPVFDLMSYNSVEELKELGLDKLKTELTKLGMKCGGTLDQRAERLWAVRGKDPKEIDPSLLAKPRR